MIGILCSQRKERLFVNFLQNSREVKQRRVPVLVFSMPNLNLTDKTVYGTLIAEGKAAAAKTGLPSVIMNFAVQHTKSHIKKLKNLAEVQNVTVLNSVNSFNQWSIMKMLASDPVTNRTILPFAVISRESVLPDIQKRGNFILKPQNGSNIKKIIYARKTENGFDVYNAGDILRSHLFDIQGAVLPTVKSGSWIFLDCPELVTHHNRLLIVRSYLQMDRGGEWKVMLKTVVSQNEQNLYKANENTDAALLRMMNYIHCYITDLAFCTVDFVPGADGTPYFLNLGGWQELSPRKRQHKILLDTLCKSITTYADEP